MLILSQADLRSLLETSEVIAAVELGFRAMACGGAVAPERLRFDIPSRDSVLLEMPSHLGGDGDIEQPALGTKIVGVFPQNPKRSLDAIQAVYLLLDAETGLPLALMDGRFLTAIRTAAASAVATKFMASPGPKQMAVFGAGVQARFHIDAMLEVANITRVMIASRTATTANSLAAEASRLHGLACEVVSAEQAASQADLICTCTSSPTPLFDGGIIKAGTHINAVGSFTPLTRELDSEAIRRARVIIDADSAAGQEAGEILIPLAKGEIEARHVKGTLADVVSGKLAGRDSDEEITLFKSCGLAIEDLVTAQLAYERATARGIGRHVEM